jgi:Polyketide cyclase / dehydrase and lipid transport
MIFVYIFLILILVLLLVAYLMPAKYSVEQSTIIVKPVSDVMGRVGNLTLYAQWNPWQQMDPTASKIISGTPGAPGHKYAWQGKKIGMGSLTLLNIDEKHIHFDLAFLKPWKTLAKDNWLFEAWGNGSETKVTWQNAGSLPWPIARLMGPMITKNLNHQFKKGLENLKGMCEA